MCRPLTSTSLATVIHPPLILQVRVDTDAYNFMYTWTQLRHLLFFLCSKFMKVSAELTRSISLMDEKQEF